MDANVPPCQVKLKATAPDSPLSSVLVAVSKADKINDLKAQLAAMARKKKVEKKRND